MTQIALDYPAPSVSDEQRRTLEALADVLIPEAHGMPAASAVGVADEWLDQVLAVRPDLVASLRAVLDGAAGKRPEQEVARLRREDEVGFGTLSLVVSGGYYLNPRVRRLVGYPGQRPRPADPDQAERDLAGGLLDPVIARGPVYRLAEPESSADA